MSRLLTFRFKYCRSCCAAVGVFLASPLTAEQILTKAYEVRTLSTEKAESALMARLQGIVLFIEPGGIIIQDDTSTTFFRPSLGETVRVGDIVEVEGRTRMGLFLPGLGSSTYRIVGQSALPPGTPVTYDDLISGRYHYQRISVEGIVQSVVLHDNSRSLIKLVVGSRLLEVRVEREPDPGRKLVDARVRINGVAAGLINERRQLVQPYVWVTDWGDLAVVTPAPDLNSVPLASASDLLVFRDSGSGRHRIRLQGIVTAAFPKGDTFLRQGKDAWSVHFRSAPLVQSGDRIELVGFPEMDRYSATVGEAELLVRTKGASPDPLIIENLDDLSGIHDAQLVTVTAVVNDAFKTALGITVRLQGRNRSIEVRLPEGAIVPEPRSTVKFTAICVVQAARRGNNALISAADGISLRTRGADDLEILQSPSWWTVRRLLGALTLLTSVTVVALLWVAILRWQVRHQTQALRRRIETEAAFEERQRIAREFHDSLQQDLTGLGLRLDAAATRTLDYKGQRIFEISRDLLTRIQAETRNFVSDLRNSAEDDGDLAKALQFIATTHQADGIELHLTFSAPPPPLPAGTVHHLRMMVRESVMNAIRHAKPTVIRIEVGLAEHLVICIVDDGTGFDAAQETNGRSGHFGCVGLRERGQKIGAIVRWHSLPGAGTTVEIVLSATALLPSTNPSLTAARP